MTSLPSPSHKTTKKIFRKERSFRKSTPNQSIEEQTESSDGEPATVPKPTKKNDKEDNPSKSSPNEAPNQTTNDQMSLNIEDPYEQSNNYYGCINDIKKTVGCTFPFCDGSGNINAKHDSHKR